MVQSIKSTDLFQLFHQVSGMSRSTAQLASYAALIFVTSALVLVVEVVAARLIAPFVGVSLYSWTAIIGVVLAGLSLGNWIGGVWADRGASKQTAGLVLLLASLSVFAVLLILPHLSEYLQTVPLSLASLSVALAGALFFIPAALLGVLTPLLITLSLQLSNRTGHMIGMLHALAALGSIFGTFVTGFYLVQWIGSRNIIIATGVVLAVLALPLLRKPVATGAAVIALLAGGLGLSGYSYQNPCERESSYFCLRVVDASHEAPFGEARSLVLDHLLHGSNHREQAQLILAPYLHLIDELAAWQTDQEAGKSYFFAGGGAYTLPRALYDRDPAAHIVVAEIDPAVTQLAEDQLYVDTTPFEVRHTDARVALQADPLDKYDVIIGDVFHDIAIPYHLITAEFSKLVKQRLKPEGIYLMNVVDTYPDPRLVKAKMKTLATEFGDVQVWMDGPPKGQARVTYVISARNTGPELPFIYESQRGLSRLWGQATKGLKTQGTPMAEIPIISDDLAPVERLMADLFLGGSGR
jgi:predicted membrane-bound spermidine synthase